MNITSTVNAVTIMLRPRPLAKGSGRFILLPLLPERTPSKPLPAEVWVQILACVFAHYNYQEQYSCESHETLKQNLLLICKNLKDVALPLYYEYIHITKPSSLGRFTERLHSADQKWDSIRRIPYSAPGRWVHTLDLSELHCNLWSEACHVDSLLTRLFPLLPFLSNLMLNQTVTLSRRMMEGFSTRDGKENLRSLKGIKLPCSSSSTPAEDAFLEVLHCCPNLEEIELIGAGLEGVQIHGEANAEDINDGLAPALLHLPRLRKLALISMHFSPVMLALLHSRLPSLQHLTITPYDDVSIPSSLVPRFIEAHGSNLTSLHLYAHKSWPTMLFPSPTTLLHTCPLLNHLSLENPLPKLTICSIYPRHPLQILSIPRPDPNFLSILETLLPKLPALRAVRARDVRWLRRGVTSRAQEAGVQGEMREWKRRLARRGIQVLDGDWKLGVD